MGKRLKFKLVLEGLQGDAPILHRTFGQSSFTENCCDFAKLVEKYVVEEIELNQGNAILERVMRLWDKRRREGMPTLADLFREWGEKEGFEKGKEFGTLEGIQAGKEEGKKEGEILGLRKGHDLAVQHIIANMIRQGLDAETIEKYVQC